ncbi:MAG: anti-sigma F factor [Oscillospiraceae bacterium]|nr:anti-sigma F factor [Oscillospiraceae bacterium]
MKLINQFSAEFPSKSANEAFARSAVACFVSQLDPTLDEINDIKTAVSEAVTNCIVHAYPDKLGKIALKVRMDDDGTILISIKDWGCGIADIAQARTPMFTTGSEERSGMGFTIMESFMQSLRVVSKPGKGTTVHMKRKIVKRGA